MKIANVFQENAVLQRDQEIPVWGKAEPANHIRASIGTATAETTCEDDGRFMLRLPPMDASLAPRILTVSNETTGETISISPVYVGEVYLCSGQSNITFKLAEEQHLSQLQAQGALDNPRIHLFKIPSRLLLNPPEDVPDTTHWEISTTDTAPNFSAIGFLFANRLSQDFPQMKIGIMESAYGGTGIESWMSYEALDANPFWHDRLALYHAPGRQDKSETERLQELFPSLPVYDQTQKDWHSPTCKDEDWETMEVPDSWTETGRNYAGIFWFRKDFTLTDIPAQGVTLHLGRIDKADETFVNGVRVGKTGDGVELSLIFTHRAYQVPASLLRKGRNVIAVRILSAVSIMADGGLIGPDTDMFVQAGNQRLPLSGTWRLREEANLGTAGADCFAYCGSGSAHSMHILYDNMIAPIVPYALRGILWYQGGCNSINQAHEYYECLKSWYADWTSRWHQRRLDIILVEANGIFRKQLYQPHSQRVLLREEQQRFCRDFKVPMVAAADTGMEYDCHPTDKLTISLRSADIATALIRGDRVPEPALALKAERLADGSITVTFDCHGSTLCPEAGESQCILRAEDGSWRAAPISVIGDNAILVKSQDFPCCQIIYNWSNFPIGTLSTRDGLPVQEFRRSVE